MGLDVNNKLNTLPMNTFLGNSANLTKYSGKTLDSIFQEADKNKNGTLDAGEVSAVLKQWNMDKMYNSDIVMQHVDGNKDGEVSFSEISSYASSLGVDLDGSQTLGSVMSGLGGLGGGLGELVKKGVNALFGLLNGGSDDKTADGGQAEKS